MYSLTWLTLLLSIGQYLLSTRFIKTCIYHSSDYSVNFIFTPKKLFTFQLSQVSELPYPFKSVKDFEASVRAPVGRLFVPETAHKKMTAPPIVTKMGTVIQPMTEDELLRSKTPGKDRKKR